MDRIHTIMRINRIPYKKADIGKIGQKGNLTILKQLTLAQASRGVLHTIDDDLLELRKKFVIKPSTKDKEKKFPEELERYYKESLNLRI